MENAYVQEFDRMYVVSLTPDTHERTCGYWYTLRARETAHTAFRTADELYRWLSERGLELESPLPEQGAGGWIPVTGRYRTVMDRDRDRFEAVEPILVTEVTDNAERTPAKITQDPDGVRVVHFMNINYRDRY
ncbi:hypothetical protein [Mycolicibacter longobardus]|uniref:Uncharacterized protein n=2 Tax=Mycolicibacter TaxID=1073531 RepID=A0A1X1YBK8_9MYCO|nr:hypothetical protein [Mycolicibacter longobardus]ORW08459.1 hypothetical protein AWC16_18840 [Mycolicibacter longobardus]RAV04430.1 hypothetical protein DQP56_01025 [Mycolicibacter senuensis]